MVSFFNYSISSIFETKDGGATWNNLDDISNPLPNFPVRWVIFNPTDNEEALIATDLGVWATDEIQGVNTSWVPVLTINGNVSITKTISLTYNSQCSSGDCVNGGGGGSARVGVSTQPFEFSVVPNPFSYQAKISYQLPEAAYVTAEIFDMQGRKVISLLENEKQSAGRYELKISPNIPKGIYFCVLRTDDQQAIVKLVSQ